MSTLQRGPFQRAGCSPSITLPLYRLLKPLTPSHSSPLQDIMDAAAQDPLRHPHPLSVTFCLPCTDLLMLTNDCQRAPELSDVSLLMPYIYTDLFYTYHQVFFPTELELLSNQFHKLSFKGSIVIFCSLQTLERGVR